MPKRTRRSSDRTIAPSSGTPWASFGSCETGRPAAGDR